MLEIDRLGRGRVPRFDWWARLSETGRKMLADGEFSYSDYIQANALRHRASKKKRVLLVTQRQTS